MSKGDVRLTFPGGTGLVQVSTTGVTLALGGFDIRISKRFSFRASVDYNPAYTGGGTTIDPRSWRDHVRFLVGIVFH